MWFWAWLLITLLIIFFLEITLSVVFLLPGVLSCESHGNSTAKQLAAFESSAPAPACFSLMNNTMSSAVILPISKSSLDDDNYAASKSTTEHIKRMVSVICKTCGSVHSGTAPRCFIRTQG